MLSNPISSNFILSPNREGRDEDNQEFFTPLPTEVNLSIHLRIDIRSGFSYICSCAGVVKLVDARDSKSREPKAHVGSIPTSGTNFNPTQLLVGFFSDLDEPFSKLR